ncbi:MAG: hypothetical protein NT007_05855 [Candidatus Kapabacteria bacterium]|nr:hypothetical protein [Candidatus Kapabacteria bacterium]
MTNGFHPLWEIVIIGISLITDNKILKLDIAFAVQQIFFLIICCLLLKIGKILNMKYLWLSFPFLATYFLSIGVYLSECHIYSLMLSLFLYYILKNKYEFNLKNSFIVGILLGFTFLSRLDSIFLLIAFISISLITGFINNKSDLLQNNMPAKSPKSILLLKIFDFNIYSKLLVTVLGFLLIASPYLIFNKIYFGHFEPISGKIKSTFPELISNFNGLGSLGKISFYISLVTLIYSFAEKEIFRKQLLRILGLQTFLLCVYVAAFTNHTTHWAWYYVPGIFSGAFLIAIFAEKVNNFMIKWIKNSAFVLILPYLFFVFISFLGISRAWSEYFNPDAGGLNPFNFKSTLNEKWQIEVANKLKLMVPEDSKIAIWDWPGYLSYYSDLNFVSFDGLTCDYNYNKNILGLGIYEFLKRNNINYYIGLYSDSLQMDNLPQPYFRSENHFTGNGQQIKVVSPIEKSYVGYFNIKDSNLIIKFSDITKNLNIKDVGLWKLEF